MKEQELADLSTDELTVLRAIDAATYRGLNLWDLLETLPHKHAVYPIAQDLCDMGLVADISGRWYITIGGRREALKAR